MSSSAPVASLDPIDSRGPAPAGVEVDPVLAHRLLNVVTVISGTAELLRTSALSDYDAAAFWNMLSRHTKLLADALTAVVQGDTAGALKCFNPGVRARH